MKTDYESRVQALEDQGLTRSDAQGVVDAELLATSGCKLQRHTDKESPIELEKFKATCGNCGKSWCDLCDPTPSALCHYCHGRGYSMAPLGPQS